MGAAAVPGATLPKSTSSNQMAGRSVSVTVPSPSTCASVNSHPSTSPFTTLLATSAKSALSAKWIGVFVEPSAFTAVPSATATWPPSAVAAGPTGWSPKMKRAER